MSSTSQYPGGTGGQLTLCREIVSFKIIRLRGKSRSNSVQRPKLRAEQPMNRGSIPDRNKAFYLQSVQTRPVLGTTPRPLMEAVGPARR